MAPINCHKQQSWRTRSLKLRRLMIEIEQILLWWIIDNNNNKTENLFFQAQFYTKLGKAGCAFDLRRASTLKKGHQRINLFGSTGGNLHVQLKKMTQWLKIVKKSHCSKYYLYSLISIYFKALKEYNCWAFKKSNLEYQRDVGLNSLKIDLFSCVLASQ